MNWLHHKDRSEREILLHIAEGVDESNRLLKDLIYVLKPRLTSIALQFKGGFMGSTPTPNVPTTLSLPVGQISVASVVGFDQIGQPFTGQMPQATYSIDNPAIASIAADTNPADEDVTGVSSGTANMTAGVQGPYGPLTCQGVITVTSATQQQVLTSVALSFAAPAATAQASAALKRK
jgi:hypothetical protein